MQADTKRCLTVFRSHRCMAARGGGNRYMNYNGVVCFGKGGGRVDREGGQYVCRNFIFKFVKVKLFDISVIKNYSYFFKKTIEPYKKNYEALRFFLG